MAHAASADAKSSFEQGRAAFEREDFATAQRLYEQALSLGMDTPAAHYNIGVAAYRKGDLDRAERAFRVVAGTAAMAGLAHYNLGLVELKRGNQAAARKYFELVARDTGDERLNGLAARQLGELPAPAPPVSWSWWARAGAGFDDNVALRSDSVDSAGTGEDDAFAELLMAASASFGEQWRADASVAMLNYSDLDEFDQRALSLGLARGFVFGGWSLEPNLVYNHLALGGDVYEQSTALGATAMRRFSGGRTLRTDVRLTSVNGEGDFSGLSGSRYEFGARYDWSWQAWELATQLRGEINDSEDEFFATRWMELGATAQYAWTPRWSLLAGATLRRTRHTAIPDFEDARSDRRSTLRFGATAKYWRSAQLFARVEHESNDSPIDFYSYDRNWIAVSVEGWY